MDDPMTNGLGTYRLGAGRAVGWWIIALMALMAGSSLVTQTGSNRIISLGLCVLVVCASYLLGVRPAVMEFPDALRVLNPIRTVHIPWSLITEVRVKDVVIVDTATSQTRCYALPRRERRSAAAAMNSAINARMPSNARIDSTPTNMSRSVVDLINDHAQSLSVGSSGDVKQTRTVDRDVVVALVTSAVALLSIGASLWA
jgi:hypothetical protein